MRQQRVFDEQGLIHAYFQRLPGQESNPLYLSIQTQIAENVPQSLDYGMTRLPVVDELLQVDRFLWQVQQVIHHQVRREEDPNDLFVDFPMQVATIQIRFYGALG